MIVRNFIQLFRKFGEDLSGRTSDDSTMNDLAIWELLVKERATIVKSLMKSNYQFSARMFQTLPCVMFEEVDAVECNLVPASGCLILKSTCEIPNTLYIKGVSSQLGNYKFDFVRWDSLQGKLNSRIKSITKDAYASIRNINGKQFLYIINDSYIENAVVEAIAEDPVKFAQFCNDKDAICNPLNLDINTDSEIQDAILKNSWRTLMELRRIPGLDIANDDAPLK